MAEGAGEGAEEGVAGSVDAERGGVGRNEYGSGEGVLVCADEWPFCMLCGVAYGLGDQYMRSKGTNRLP